MRFASRLIEAFKNKLPSWAEMRSLFWVVLAFNNIWAFYVLSKNVDRLLRALTIWEYVGVGAYTLAQALLDSALQVAIIALLAGLLPRTLLAKRFVPLGFALAVILFGTLNVYYNLAVPYQSDKQAALGFSLLCLAIGLAIWLLSHFKTPQHWGQFLLPRITVLSAFYLVLDLAGAAIVLLRNLFPTL